MEYRKIIAAVMSAALMASAFSCGKTDGSSGTSGSEAESVKVTGSQQTSDVTEESEDIIFSPLCKRNLA